MACQNRTATFERNDQAQPEWMHPNRCGLIRGEDGTKLGYIGTIHPDVAEALNLGPFCAVFEIDLSTWEVPLKHSTYTVTPRYPSVTVDISVIVTEETTHDQIATLLWQAHKRWVRAVHCVAVYRGDPIPSGEKSVSFTLTLQSNDDTLEMEAVNRIVDKAKARLTRELGGWFRE